MKIALVELSESHEECMYSQVRFLKDAGHQISLIVHPKIPVEDYISLVEDIELVDFDSILKLSAFSLQLQLVKKLKHFDKVIFNTASSSKNLRNIVFFLNAYNTECIGVIHHVKKLNKSFTQSVISTKIKKYFTLSDALKEAIVLKNKSLSLESFYPIFFPKFEKTDIYKKEDDVWICIPGRVFFDRRDYDFLIGKLRESPIPKNIKFIILGNINNHDGLKLRQSIETHQMSDAFLIFEKFIPNDLFYNYLDQSDYIMPLLQKQDKNYLDSKITGAFNLAFGFKKPLLFHEFYKSIPDLNANGISYNEHNFHSVLSAISNKTIGLPLLYQDEKWTYKYQQRRYINFINN